MKRKTSDAIFIVFLIVCFSALVLAWPSSSGGGVYTPEKNKTDDLIISIPQINLTLPVIDILPKTPDPQFPYPNESLQNFSDRYTQTILDNHQTKYKKYIPSITVKTDDAVPYAYYDVDVEEISIGPSVYWEEELGWRQPEVVKYLKIVIRHEVCHYIQDKTCRFDSYEESFCEVYAGVDNTVETCEENGWPYYYCAPFRLGELKDHKSFTDCVFKDACAYGGAKKYELESCYQKWKK
jgi:hypothetical protein